MSIYNLKTDGDQYRITKFDTDLNVESSYLCTEAECECPAGHRSTCRHRQMLPVMLANRLEDTSGFYDFDNKQVLVPVCEEDGVEVEEVEDGDIPGTGEDESFDPEQMPDGVEKDEAMAQADVVEIETMVILPETADVAEEFAKLLHDAGSPSGKAGDFDSPIVGSNPTPAAIHPTIGKIIRRI